METPTRRNCSALILAGGRGVRMGETDKAALLWNAERFVDRQYRCLRQQVDAVWINRGGDSPPNQQLPGPVCRDQFVGRGPLAGIHAGFTQLATPWLFVVPCDAPMLAPELFGYLARTPSGPLQHDQTSQQQFGPHSGTTTEHRPVAAAAIDSPLRYAHDGERGQYLFALLHVSLLPNLSHYLQAGGRTVREWYRSRSASAIDCASIRTSFTNINTPAQYQTLPETQ